MKKGLKVATGIIIGLFLVFTSYIWAPALIVLMIACVIGMAIVETILEMIKKKYGQTL